MLRNFLRFLFLSLRRLLRIIILSIMMAVWLSFGNFGAHRPGIDLFVLLRVWSFIVNNQVIEVFASFTPLCLELSLPFFSFKVVFVHTFSDMLLDLELSTWCGFCNIKLLELFFQFFHLLLALLEVKSVRSLIVLFKGFLFELYVFSCQILELWIYNIQLALVLCLYEVCLPFHLFFSKLDQLHFLSFDLLELFKSVFGSPLVFVSGSLENNSFLRKLVQRFSKLYNLLL